MTIKLIAADMDGTLLDSQGSYDRDCFNALFQRLKKDKIEFVVASGNNIKRLHSLFAGLENEISYVAENGSHVVAHGRDLVKNILSQELVRECLDFFEGNHARYRLVLTGEKEIYVRKDAVFTYRGLPLTKEQIEEVFSSLTFLENFDSLPADQFLKVTVIVPEADVDEILSDFNQQFAGRLRAVTSGFGAIDIVQTGIDKAWGLAYLMKEWQIDSSQVMAFGDNNNDKEMLELAYYSYAMGNANQEVKSISRFQAPTNEEAGVLQVMEDYLDSREGKKEWPLSY